jgi:hypothetical protein
VGIAENGLPKLAVSVEHEGVALAQALQAGSRLLRGKRKRARDLAPAGDLRLAQNVAIDKPAQPPIERVRGDNLPARFLAGPSSSIV